METRYILTTQALKDSGLIHGNVEDELLLPIMIRVQDTVIQSMLGTALYVKILDLVQAWNNGAGTAVPAPYANLLYNFIIPAMVPHVEMRSTTFLTWRMRNAGTGSFNDQYFKTSTRQEVTDLKQLIENDAAAYDNALLRHLEWSLTNGTNGGKLYPEYVCGQHQDGGIDPDTKKKTTGNALFIKGGRYKC